MKNDNIYKKEQKGGSRELESERLFREIGLGRKEDRDRFKTFALEQEKKIDYEIRFSNNTKKNNG
jgi:hypothetical protein